MRKLNMLCSKNRLQSVSGCYKKSGVVTIVLDQYPLNLGCRNVYVIGNQPHKLFGNWGLEIPGNDYLRVLSTSLSDKLFNKLAINENCKAACKF